MKRGGMSAGFTIVETMIVLAVTGALFTAIVVTLSGRQHSNEFSQAIQDARAQIQQTISEVQAGYYANLGNFDCQAGPSGPTFTNVSSGQGTNQDCIYLGDALQFGLVDAAGNQEIGVWPVAGLRAGTDLASAKPTPIAGVNEMQTTSLKYGLTVTAMAYGSGNTPTGAVGILSSVSDVNTVQTGTPQIDVYAISNTSLTASETAAESSLVSAFHPATDLIKNPDGGIKICLKSGGTDQYGLITVGENHQQLSVDLQILANGGGSTTCGL